MATTQITLGYPAGTNFFTETSLGNTALVVKNASGTVYFIDVDNTANAAASYLKIYDTNAAVTVGTTVPDDVLKIPASTRVPIPIPAGKVYASGIQVACVTAGGTAGTSSPSSAVVCRVVYA